MLILPMPLWHCICNVLDGTFNVCLMAWYVLDGMFSVCLMAWYVLDGMFSVCLMVWYVLDGMFSVCLGDVMGHPTHIFQANCGEAS